MADEEDLDAPEEDVPAEEAPEEAPAEDVDVPPEEEFQPPVTSSKTALNFPKKGKIIIDPNATIDDLKKNPNILTSLPVIPEGQGTYTPMLYTFRVKVKEDTKNLSKVVTKSPPFYLLLDHAIPVVWTLFNSGAKKENLGISQLQWALYFLKGIFNNDGLHPKDIQLAIDAIQDYLVDEYADMSEESVVYGASHIGDYNGRKDVVNFSVNYSQMIDKCPARAPEEDDYGIMDPQLLAELENIKKVVGIDKIDVRDSVSKDKALNILADWKREQIEKIQEEMKMLKTVEDMMKNVDIDSFEGYTEQTLFCNKSEE